MEALGGSIDVLRAADGVCLRGGAPRLVGDGKRVLGVVSSGTS
jgi:hypothetical protein